LGQKVNPVGFRLGVIRSWDSKWFEEKNYAKWLHQDLKLRAYVKEKLNAAGISKVEIERAASKVKISVHTARPGVVIGKRGAEIDKIKKDLQSFTENEVFLNVVEVRKAEIDAQLVAENIATQLERRIAFRRAMKKAVQTALKFGAKGIRVACSGRLAAPRCRDTSGTARGEFRCIPSAPTSTTASLKPRPPTERSASSAGSSAERSFPGAPAASRRDAHTGRPTTCCSQHVPSSASR